MMSYKSLPAMLSFLTAMLLATGCWLDEPTKKAASNSGQKPPPVETKKAPMGQNVWLEIQGQKRRVVIDAYVCLREGLLEHLMCRKNTKEHEAILAADIDARDIHKALLAAGAEPGAPARYDPTYRPPSGAEIAITLQYVQDSKTHSVTGQKWVRSIEDKKELKANWVFVGSVFYPDPVDEKKPPAYAANSGDVICVSNFEDALLDVSIKSSKDNSELAFEAWTERIPPLGTQVKIILEPIEKQKKSSK
jgi:hypothetical protein